MNVVDIVIVVFAVALAAVGFERGLIGSAVPLAGFVAGAALGSRLGPELLAGGAESAYAPVITVLSGLILGAVLAVALDGVGVAARARIERSGAAARLDGAGGGLLLAALALLLAWAFGAVALHTPAQGAKGLRTEVQRSAILGALNQTLPPSGPLLNVLRRIDPTPTLEGPEANVSAPDAGLSGDPQVDAAGNSVVRVLGTACGLGVEGSGWVAGPGLVVTNAHVVAGQDDTTVTFRSDAGELDAQAVHYDPLNDLALLNVEGLESAPLRLAPDPAKGTAGAALGYPENGPFDVSPARLGTTGTVLSQDSYGRGPKRRQMTSFRGQVRSGNSGGPVVDGDGRVLTTVFAAEQGGGPPAGLGIPNPIVADALSARLREVDTGPCAA